MINNPFNSTSNLQLQEHERRLFNRFVENANTKSPLAPKGKLVKETPLEKVTSSIKDVGHDVVNLGKALKDGESCDHHLGRLNDLGLKLGGLGIAAYLFTRKSSPKAKIMEFVGGTTFFATMALWPKLMIGAPIKARYGFDFQQKYIDSQGRKKELFLDNGYIPKLETKEELSELADRLNVPKHMEFREEYALEKRRRIALQGRTLWMLTAGFATPLMTALACDQVEKHIDKPIIKAGAKRAKHIASNLSSVADRTAGSVTFEQAKTNTINSVRHYNGVVDDAFLSRLATAFTPTEAKITANVPDCSKEIAKDLRALYNSLIDADDVSESIVDLIKSRSTQKDGGILSIPVINPELPADAPGRIKMIDVKEDDIVTAVKNVVQDIKKGKIEYTPEAIMDALRKQEGINPKKGVAKAKEGMEGVVNAIREKRIKSLAKQLLTDGDASSRSEALKLARRNVETDADFIRAVEEATKSFDGTGVASAKTGIFAMPAEILTDKDSVFSRLIDAKKRSVTPKFIQRVQKNYLASKQANAVVATMDDVVRGLDNSFGGEYFGIVDSIFDVISPDMRRLESLRSNADGATDYIAQCFQEIVQDKQKCKKLIAAINKAPIMTDDQRQELIDTVLASARKRLHEISGDFDPEMRTLIGFTDVSSSSASGFVGDLDKYVREAVSGIDATKDRLNLVLDFEMRYADGTLLKQWEAAQAQGEIKQTFPQFVDDARAILYKSTMNSFSNTHEIKQNGAYYQRLHDILFNQSMSEDSKAMFESATTGLVGKLNKFRVKLMAIASNGVQGEALKTRSNHASDYVNVMNFINPEIIKDEGLRQVFTETLQETDAIKYQTTGKPIKNLIFENAGQKFNQKAWKKIFVPMALALVGVTLVAQLFFGRDKDKELYMKKDNHTGAVNGN